jgi:hypothetical protein
LDEPEVDVYRRDNGIIHKYRFFLENEFDHEEGLKFIEPFFKAMLTGLKKRNYEGLDVLHTYCSDKQKFRGLEPRTKLGKDIKSILNPIK